LPYTQNAYFSRKFIEMKKRPFFLSLFFLWLASSCSEKTDFTLKGKIDNLSSDTLLVYYEVPQSKLDTLICQGGEFTYTFSPDTFTILSLILDNQELLPIYAEKGETVEISKTDSTLTVKGKGENKLLTQIMDLLKGLSPEDTKMKVDSFIQANPESFTNLYLIDKYYTRNDSANYNDLEPLTQKLHGIIKDTPYMIQLQAKIEALKNPNKNQSILSLQAIDKNGEDIKWNSLRDKYILLNFWASWHPQSVSERDSLKALFKEIPKDIKKEDFIVYNISLDMDKKTWLQACDEETDLWKHICDFKGWNNFVLRNQNIHQLPYNILLSPAKRILERNIPRDKMVDKLKQHIKPKNKKNR